MTCDDENKKEFLCVKERGHGLDASLNVTKFVRLVRLNQKESKDMKGRLSRISAGISTVIQCVNQ